MTDLLLTIAHHLLVFALTAILAMEVSLVRPGLDAATLRRVGAADLAYGAVAGLILAVGFARVYWGAKGPEFFLSNPWFWAKIAAFVVVGLLSAPPTVRFLAWRRRLKDDPAALPSPAEIGAVRRFLILEMILFAAIPVLAAMMVRYGAF
jgi:putative membrane protein